MTEFYRIVEVDGRDQCFLFCGKPQHEPGIHIASVRFWKRGSEGSDPSVKHFHSTLSGADAQTKAEKWIKESLFSDYQVFRWREDKKIDVNGSA